MASIIDTTLNFFTKATPEQWSYVLNLYRDVFKIHAEATRGSRKNGSAELIKLDVWYQEQLPELIRSRKEHQLFYDEIVQITKWKLLRGKFRPSILDLVKTNTETAVKNTTKKAFRKMPNISAAINALTQLKGIGVPTASAILVAYSPNHCPYMTDENLASTSGVEITDNTTSEYMNYVERVQSCVDKLKELDPETNWTPHKVELAIWTHYMIKQYNLDLLDNMFTTEAAAVTISTNEKCNESFRVDDKEDDENQVGSSYQSSLNEVNLNQNSNSNLIDSNRSIDDDSSQHCELSSVNNGIVDVTQSDNESDLNSLSLKNEASTAPLSSTSFDMINSNSKSTSNDKNYLNSINSNLEDANSNLSSVVSSVDEQNSLKLVRLNRGLILEDSSSSSNNVSSTNNCISQSTSKLNKSISNGDDESNNEVVNSESNNDESNNEVINSESNNGESNNGESNHAESNHAESNHAESNHETSNKVGSSLIKQHFNLLTSQNNYIEGSNYSNLSLPNTNDSSEKFSTISSSCEEMSNNVNSSADDSIQIANKKRSNSSSSSSLSNLKQTRLCVNNCNDALDDNAVSFDHAVSFDPDSNEQLSKRQKLIN